MKTDQVIALDVGGTFIKAGVVKDGQLVEETLQQYPAHSDEDKPFLINHFISIILEQADRCCRSTAAQGEQAGHTGQAELDGQAGSIRHAGQVGRVGQTELDRQARHAGQARPAMQAGRAGQTELDRQAGHAEYEHTPGTWGIGFAFPGPFDYENGVSYIRGLSKFQSLYGLSVREELQERLQVASPELWGQVAGIRFENDARLFGLGASTRYPQERLLGLTIGTGLGSVFIDKGTLLTASPSAPKDGYLFNQPFGDSCADDYFSRRGILKRAAALGLPPEADVKELAAMAIDGHSRAISIFQAFGDDLGQFLQPYVDRFDPQRIVIGGQIAQSAQLFRSRIEALLPRGVVVEAPVKDSAHLPMLGIAQLFKSKSIRSRQEQQ